jgi:hypothetical protein
MLSGRPAQRREGSQATRSARPIEHPQASAIERAAPASSHKAVLRAGSAAKDAQVKHLEFG